MSQFTNEEKIEICNFLTGSFYGFQKVNRIKTWMSEMKEVTNLEWWDSKSIGEKFGTYYSRFIPNIFFKPTTGASVFNTLGDEQIKMVIKRNLWMIRAKVGRDNREEVYNTILGYSGKTNKYYCEMMGVAVPVESVESTVAVVSVNEIADRVDGAVKEYLEGLDVTSIVKGSIEKVGADAVKKVDAIKNEIDEMIKVAVARLTPTVIKINDVEVRRFEGATHKAFATTLKKINRHGQVFIAGPAGTGKSTLGAQVATAMGLKFSFISCTLGMSEAHLLGRMDAMGNYIKSSFVDIYENGGVFLFDEVDAADANTMLVINSALANGMLSVPNRKENQVAMRHEKFYCMCAANTWGFGSNDYAGRNILDAAFLDRFSLSRIIVDYDMELEAALGSTELVERVWRLRRNVRENKMKRVVSTRLIVEGMKCLADGETVDSIIESAMVGWTAEEISKASR